MLANTLLQQLWPVWQRERLFQADELKKFYNRVSGVNNHDRPGLRKACQ